MDGWHWYGWMEWYHPMDVAITARTTTYDGHAWYQVEWHGWVGKDDSCVTHVVVVVVVDACGASPCVAMARCRSIA